jgi:hypothetical protein
VPIGVGNDINYSSLVGIHVFLVAMCVLFGHTLESMIFLCVTRYYLQMSKVSKEKMKEDIDEFGDFYFVDIDVSDVRQVFPQCST